MTGLADAIEQAKIRERVARWDANEQRLLQELKLDIPRPALAKDVLERLNIFGKWCEARSVRKCPCKPHVLASFCISQHQMGAAPQVILALLAAVEALHDHHGLSNPVRTSAVRAALDTIIKIDPPRSWPRADRILFAELPPDIREITARREQQRDKALRRLQNEAAERRHNGAEKKPVIKPNEETKLCQSDAETTA